MKLSSALAWLGGRAPSVVVPPAAPPRVEPALLLPAPPPAPAANDHDEAARGEAAWDPRRISPRRFAEITHELYIEGVLSWAEYRMVGFPSELHPDYDITIGALIGEKAAPDRPRDMLAEWEQRVEFERRHNPDDREIRRAERVLEVLRNNGRPLPRFRV
ncbi:MAG: hypothetical protein ACM33T_09270 [Solirubrobacterales bacterium]